MGQALRGRARTTEAVRRAIQHGQASLRELARRHGVNPKTIAKWRARQDVADRRTGPAEARSTTLSAEEEAMVVAFRRDALLPLDDCLHALQPSLPHLTRSSLHRCLARRGISRLPKTEGGKPVREHFKAYPIGFFHIDIAEVRTERGKLHSSSRPTAPQSSPSPSSTSAPPSASPPTSSAPCSGRCPAGSTPC